MEHKDEQYMQTTQHFVSSSMDNMQQQLNVAGCGVVGAAVAGDIGSKYDDHQHEEHDVGDDNEWKYVKEVQQSEKQQTLKDYDDSEFTVKERAVCGSLLLGNGDDRIDKVGDGVDSESMFDFGLDSNRSANGVGADYEILMHTKEEKQDMFDNVLPTYNNVVDNTNTYTFDGMSANTYADIIKADGDLSITSNISESVKEDNVPQVDVKIENMIPQNCAPDQDAADEEEPSSLADNTTNETSSLSESAPQPINDEQMLMCAIESRSMPISMDDKDNLTPSQLNPDAKEFVPSYGSNPTSPTSLMPIGGEAAYNKGEDPLFGEPAYPNIANRQLLPDDDEFVAESPRKGHAANMDNIALPAELIEFKHEADQRPHELQPDSEGEIVERTEVTTKQLDNNFMEYNQSLHGDFTDRMSSILLENGPESYGQNIYDADVEQYVADSDEDGDVMKRSVYVANDEPIEDILNTVQLLPTDSESGNTSFVEETAHAGEGEDDIGMANKELLQVEEKEHVSHSPSTEEMHLNLVSNELKLQPHEAAVMEHSFNNETLQQQQPQQQQSSTTTLVDRKAEAQADAIVLSDSGNDESDDIIIVENDDEEIFGAPAARDLSGMVFETSVGDHFSQEKDVETLTTTVIDLESEYNSNVDAGEAHKEEFERNLLNYVNEPLTDDQQQMNEVEEHSPAKMEDTEMIGNAYEDIHMLSGGKSCEVAVTAHPSETITNQYQTVPVEDNAPEVKASEMLFSIDEEKPAALPVAPVNVEFGVEAHKDIYSENKLSTEFNDFTKLSATEYSEEPPAKRTIAVECIQLDDIIETAATVAKDREEGELIDAAVIALESLTVKDETLQTLDKALGMDELEPTVPFDTHIDPVTVTAVAAAAAATTAVAAPAMVEVVKKPETSKKQPLAATSKPGGAAVSSKAKVGTKSGASAKSVGVGKKPSTLSTTIKSPTRGTVEAATKAAKPKVSATEKVATAAGSSEKKTLKAITKTMPTVKQSAFKATTTTTTTPTVRAASAGTKSSAMGAKPGNAAVGQKSGASVTSAKSRPTTAPSSTTTSIGPPKPTTLGLTVAANGTTSKPKMRSPRSTLTTQVRKAAATAAKSPVKAPPSAINGTSSKTVPAKASTRASGVNSGSGSTTTTNKMFTARPAPKFTTSNATTTTATTKRTVTTTSTTATLSVGNKTSTRSLSKTPPMKLTTTTTAAKANKTTPSKASTMASKTKAATTGKVTPNKNTAAQSPIAIKRPQQHQEDPKIKPVMSLPISITEETSQAVNSDANLATENKIDPQAFSHLMTNGDAQSLFTIDHDHKSPVPLDDA